MSVSFTADAKDLRRVVSVLRKALPSHKALPVLQGIKVEVSGDDVALTATDESLTIRTRLTGGQRDGEAVIHGRLLADVLKVAAGPVTVASSDKVVTVSDADGKWDLEAWLPADDFPSALPPLPKRWLPLPEDFATGLGQILPAVSKDSARPILNAVFFEAEGDHLRLVATDSYRLAVRDFDFKAPAKPLLLPLPLLQFASKATHVRYAVREGHAFFDADGVVTSARLVGGVFPNYRKLMPEGGTPATLDRQSLLNALARSRPLWSEPFGVDLDLAHGCLSVDSPRGRASISLGTKSARVEKARFNPNYLGDGVRACGDDLSITIHGPEKPALLASASYRYLLMPIRVA